MSKKSAGLIIGGAALLVLLVAMMTYVNLSPKSSQTSSGNSADYAKPESGLGYDGGDAYYGGVPAPMPAPTMPGRDASIMPPYYETGGKTAAEVDQKIIKTGSLSIKVERAQEAANEIIVLAQGKGGFVQNSSVSENADGTHYGNVTIRVPSKDFETTLAAIRALATFVQNESVSGQDVTEQFTDLQAQLKNAKAQEAQYLEILKQARSVEDILAVQRELGSIRAQIESLQGRIQYLENVTSYSTISIALSEEPTVNIPTKEFRPVTIIKQAFRALGVLAQEMATFLIWFIIIGVGTMVPLLLLAYIVYRIAMRFMRRRSNVNPRR